MFAQNPLSPPRKTPKSWEESPSLENSPEMAAATPLKRKTSNAEITPSMICNALLEGVPPAILEQIKSKGTLSKYEFVDPTNVESRAVNRNVLDKFQTVLLKMAPFGLVNKSVFAKGIKEYAGTIGTSIGIPGLNIMDQAWAVKRMLQDVESIKKN